MLEITLKPQQNIIHTYEIVKHENDTKLMWVEYWKLSYKGGGDINLAFIKIEDAKDMNIVENSKVKI